MTGVTTTTSVRSGPANGGAPIEGRYFVVGQFDRGNTATPTRVRSLAEVEREFGSRVSYGAAYDDLRVFFEEGGSEAYVARIVGASATKGTLMLVDRAGSPDDTLRIDAVSAGAWSANATVQVKAGTLSNTFCLVVTGPDGSIETYDNLDTVAAAETALTKSRFVRGTDQGSASSGVTAFPAVAAATALSAGSDDRASLTGSSYTDALAQFTPDLGTGAVAIPGQPSSTVGAATITHCKALGRIYLGATAVGQSTSQAKSAATALLSSTNDCAGLFYPWVRTPLGGGATKLVSPEGYVAAKRAVTIAKGGPWDAAAGDVAEAKFIVGLETELTKAQGDDLNEGNVNAIRTVQGTIRTYGWRSLSTDVENFRLLTGRDTLNLLRYRGEAALEPYVFKTVDGAGLLLAQIKGAIVGIVEPIRAAGGVYELTDESGQRIDPGYSVDVSSAVNPLVNLQNNQVAAVLAVRLSPSAEFITLNIVKAALTASV